MARADDEVLILRPSRVKWIGLLAGGGALTAVSIALLLVESHTADRVGLILSAAFFGLATIVAACQLVPGTSYLRIGPDGLVMKTLWRTHRQAWEEIERFQVYEVRSGYSTQRQVGFVLRESRPGTRSFGRSLSRTLAGVDGGLPDTYGLGVRELLALLEARRERYAGAQPATKR